MPEAAGGRYALPADPPLVTVVVPTTGDPELLGPCLEGLLHRTDYPRVDVVVTLSEEALESPEQRSALEHLTGDARVRLLAYPPRPFNFSWVCNRAAAAARRSSSASATTIST